MKMKGRMMLLLTLIVAVALSAISYKGIGSKKALSVHRIEQGLDLSGGVDIVYEADQKSVTDDEMKAAISLLQGRAGQRLRLPVRGTSVSACRFPVWRMRRKPFRKSDRPHSFPLQMRTAMCC